MRKEWKLTKCLQALAFSVLPSYWDITSDVRQFILKGNNEISFQIWLGITFLTMTCGSRYCQIGTPDYIWGRFTKHKDTLDGGKFTKLLYILVKFTTSKS